jgi:hypothetical protein
MLKMIYDQSNQSQITNISDISGTRHFYLYSAKAKQKSGRREKEESKSKSASLVLGGKKEGRGLG